MALGKQIERTNCSTFHRTDIESLKFRGTSLLRRGLLEKESARGTMEGETREERPFPSSRGRP